MLKNEIVICDLLSDIGRVMFVCKRKLKNRAIIGNLSVLAPVLQNETSYFVCITCSAGSIKQ